MSVCVHKQHGHRTSAKLILTRCSLVTTALGVAGAVADGSPPQVIVVDANDSDGIVDSDSAAEGVVTDGGYVYAAPGLENTELLTLNENK